MNKFTEEEIEAVKTELKRADEDAYLDEYYMGAAIELILEARAERDEAKAELNRFTERSAENEQLRQTMEAQLEAMAADIAPGGGGSLRQYRSFVARIVENERLREAFNEMLKRTPDMVTRWPITDLFLAMYPSLEEKK